MRRTSTVVTDLKWFNRGFSGLVGGDDRKLEVRRKRKGNVTV